MTQKFTAEEVREKAHAYSLRGDSRTAAMLDTLAERIEADERAVPVAWMTHHDEPMLFLVTEEAAAYCDDDEMPIPLFVHPPAQAAQVADAFRRGYDQAKLEESINADLQTAPTPTAEPAQPADSGRVEAEHKFFARDFYEEAREGKKAWSGQCDSGRVDNEGLAESLLQIEVAEYTETGRLPGDVREVLRRAAAALAAQGQGEAAMLKALRAIKLRLHFMGWPAESMWNNGTTENPHWITDWRYEIALLEHALHGSPVTADEKPADTMPRHSLPTLPAGVPDGCIPVPRSLVERWANVDAFNAPVGAAMELKVIAGQMLLHAEVHAAHAAPEGE